MVEQPGEHCVYLSLGSNLGDRSSNLHAALARLNSRHTLAVIVSDVYETTHVGEADEPIPDYLNCIAAVATDLEPTALLNYTQEIEQECGRTPTYRWGPRVIDID